MTDRDRIPWLRLWKANLERAIPGPWNLTISLAIDRAMMIIEATA